jgi:nucleotidyltransferase AbiEii toxin of type IV toxin-antitoxin system
MREDLRSRLQGSSGPQEARNRVREYLQARLLLSLQRSGAMVPLAFQGGTALRFLYSIRRYSEDLDFALERADRGYDFTGYLQRIQTDLRQEGYVMEARATEKRTVHSAFVRFPGLLHELGLSPHSNEVFSIKVEVDTRPPAGAGLETTVVRRHVMLHLQHHDQASLLAGKLHAILQRSYPKGRDLYDLVWYLSDPSWPPPNLAMLNNALRQTGWSGEALEEKTWREAVLARMHDIDWRRVAADVSPFLEVPDEVSLLTEETIVRVLGRRGRSQE